MKAGQFVLFNERTVHHSEPNRSQKRRIGLAVRVIMPIVKVLQWDAPEHALVQIAGEDRLQFNRTTQPPFEELYTMGMTDEEKFRFDLNGYLLLREAILTPDEIAEIKDKSSACSAIRSRWNRTSAPCPAVLRNSSLITPR